MYFSSKKAMQKINAILKNILPNTLIVISSKIKILQITIKAKAIKKLTSSHTEHRLSNAVPLQLDDHFLFFRSITPFFEPVQYLGDTN